MVPASPLIWPRWYSNSGALPAIVYARTGVSFNFGGTSIIIVIGVALDTMKQLEAQLMMRNYEGFLKA